MIFYGQYLCDVQKSHGVKVMWLASFFLDISSFNTEQNRKIHTKNTQKIHIYNH